METLISHLRDRNCSPIGSIPGFISTQKVKTSLRRIGRRRMIVGALAAIISCTYLLPSLQGSAYSQDFVREREVIRSRRISQNLPILFWLRTRERSRAAHTSTMINTEHDGSSMSQSVPMIRFDLQISSNGSKRRFLESSCCAGHEKARQFDSSNGTGKCRGPCQSGLCPKYDLPSWGLEFRESFSTRRDD